MSVARKTKRIISGILVGAVVVLATLAVSNRHASAACSADTSRGSITTNFSVPADGSYTFWARMQATSDNNDSIYVSIDNSDCITIGDAAVPTNAWKWVNYKNGQTSNIAAGVKLTAGVHSIQVIGREDGVRVDRIMLLDGCTPAANGNGDDCLTQSDSQQPTVALTSPTANATKLNGNIQLAATASDNVAIVKVDFSVDGKLNKSVTSAPYSYSLDTTAFTDGSHSITATAYDSTGLSTVSSPVTVSFLNTAVPANKPPTVTISSPVTTYTAPANITLNASASDSDGSISKVEFFNGSAKIGEATTSPYALKWNGTNAGNYTITAKATDNQAAAANSNSLNLQVTQPVAQQTDTTKPSTPTGLTRGLLYDGSRFSYVIRLNWQPSTDNVGVKNYVIKRNGVVIDKPTGTTYDDANITANTLYTYTVEAQDAAGNTSNAAETKIKGSCFLIWCSES